MMKGETSLSWQESYDNSNNQSLQLWWTEKATQETQCTESWDRDKLKWQKTTFSLILSAENLDSWTVEKNCLDFFQSLTDYILRTWFVWYIYNIWIYGSNLGTLDRNTPRIRCQAVAWIRMFPDRNLQKGHQLFLTPDMWGHRDRFICLSSLTKTLLWCMWCCNRWCAQQGSSNVCSCPITAHAHAFLYLCFA